MDIQKLLHELEVVANSFREDIPGTNEKRQSLLSAISIVLKEVPMEVTEIHVDEFVCPKCGAELSKDDNTSCVPEQYCRYCGQKVYSDGEEY